MYEPSQLASTFVRTTPPAWPSTHGIAGHGTATHVEHRSPQYDPLVLIVCPDCVRNDTCNGWTPQPGSWSQKDCVEERLRWNVTVPGDVPGSSDVWSPRCPELHAASASATTSEERKWRMPRRAASDGPRPPARSVGPAWRLASVSRVRSRRPGVQSRGALA